MNDNGPSPVLKLLNTRYVQVFSSNVVHVYGRGLRSTEVLSYESISENRYEYTYTYRYVYSTFVLVKYGSNRRHVRKYLRTSYESTFEGTFVRKYESTFVLSYLRTFVVDNLLPPVRVQYMYSYDK